MRNVAPSAFYVYVLLDPRKPGKFRFGKHTFKFEPFYVGKGKGNRCKVHLSPGYTGKNSHKRSKIDRIHAAGFKVQIVKAQENLNEAEAFELERELIRSIGRHDLRKGPLVNKTDGGEGMSGHLAGPVPEERKARIAESLLRTYAERTEADWKLISDAVKDGLAKVSKEEMERLNASRSVKVQRGWEDMTDEQRARRIRNMSKGWKNRTAEERAASSIRRSQAGKKWRAAKSVEWWKEVAYKRAYTKRLHSIGAIPEYKPF